MKDAFVYGEDYGTSKFKFGPVFLHEKPEMIDNRGYFPSPSQLLPHMMEEEVKEVVVGEEVQKYLETIEDLSTKLIYPMRKGVVRKDDKKAWKVIKEITKYGLLKFFPKRMKEFNGFYVVSSLAAQSPRYMYERIFEVHKEINEEENVPLVNSITIIPQPLAVAISHKAVTCTVIESGHGNTQITPVSRGLIRGAIIALNRGGSDANAITAQILKDIGYSDLAREEKFVTLFKEEVGLLPLDLNMAIDKAKRNPERFGVIFKVPGTSIEVELKEDSWQRFLIGEYIFNPQHEIFESYYQRGFTKPRDTYIAGEEVIPGLASLSEVIIKSVEKCPTEIQPMLYRDIILSGGNFLWRVPLSMVDVATNSQTKIKLMLEEKGIPDVIVRAAENPQYSVWRGAIVYGLSFPEEVEWNWEKMEGWLKLIN